MDNQSKGFFAEITGADYNAKRRITDQGDKFVVEEMMYQDGEETVTAIKTFTELKDAYACVWDMLKDEHKEMASEEDDGEVEFEYSEDNCIVVSRDCDKTKGLVVGSHTLSRNRAYSIEFTEDKDYVVHETTDGYRGAFAGVTFWKDYTDVAGKHFPTLGEAHEYVEKCKAEYIAETEAGKPLNERAAELLEKIHSGEYEFTVAPYNRCGRQLSCFVQSYGNSGSAELLYGAEIEDGNNNPLVNIFDKDGKKTFKSRAFRFIGVILDRRDYLYILNAPNAMYRLDANNHEAGVSSFEKAYEKTYDGFKRKIHELAPYLDEDSIESGLSDTLGAADFLDYLADIKSEEHILLAAIARAELVFYNEAVDWWSCDYAWFTELEERGEVDGVIVDCNSILLKGDVEVDVYIVRHKMEGAASKYVFDVCTYYQSIKKIIPIENWNSTNCPDVEFAKDVAMIYMASRAKEVREKEGEN